MDIKKAADALREAETSRTAIAPLTEENPDLSLTDAYAIQIENLDRRLDQERVVGMKVGVTNPASRRKRGFPSPTFGHLTDAMQVFEDDVCDLSALIAPKIEGEIAFCLKKPLEGPGVTLAEVYDAIDFVVPALEIVDSRIGWSGGMTDMVADNSFAARFVLGSCMRMVHKIDMRLTGMIMEKNGELIGSAAAAVVMGNPAMSVAWLANSMSKLDLKLPAGSVILTGALFGPVPIEDGDCFRASFCGMGGVTMRFKRQDA